MSTGTCTGGRQRAVHGVIRHRTAPGGSVSGLLGVVVLALVLAGCADRGTAAAGGPLVREPIPDSAFGRLHRQLSGPGAYFDTDNLISNEDSYLHAVGTLRAAGVRGGVYLGVGPDQNFSYIAEVRPDLALIMDIRRDNVLLHLLFRSLFRRSEDRLEYLCALFGRSCPDADTSHWTVAELLATLDRSSVLPDRAARLRAALREDLRSSPVALSGADLKTIDGFHRRYITEGPDLKFNTHGRPPNPSYPTYRRLLLETTRAGEPASFMATEAGFRVVDTLQDANRVIPLVGDLGGRVALPAIGEWLVSAPRFLDPGHAHVRVFYTSNVEFYLFRQGRFARFVQSLRGLPHDDGFIIRSYFSRMRRDHPNSVAGYYNTQMVHPVGRLLADWERGAIGSYRVLIRRGIVKGG